MNTYKIVYPDGRVIIEKANKAIDIIRKYDLTSRENAQVKVIQL